MTHSSSSIGISFAILMFYGASITGTILLSRDNGADNEVLLQKPDKPSPPKVNIVNGGESRLKPEDCIATLVGPDINQPDPFPGYSGFVGWVSPMRLRSGDWLVGFSAGYWHASAPTPLRYSSENLVTYLKLGLPADIVAPTGGRAMIIRSTDKGKTWSKPETILDSPDDDRHPSFIELPDGTLLCTVFTYPGVDNADQKNNPALSCRTAIIRSFDNGKTWDNGLIRLPSPFVSDETNGPMVLLNDGSVLLTIDGTPENGGPTQVAVFKGTDRGATWQLLSTIKAGNKLQEVTISKEMDTEKSRILSEEHNLDEANTAVLSDGQWVMIARPKGYISWSGDQGHTWTEPVNFGMRLYAPSLYVLHDGTLVCLHGSYEPDHAGLRVIFSTDGGHTWIAPAKNYGFLVSNCYGYAKAMELPDGSLFITDQDKGGHTTHDAQNMSIRCLILKIRTDHSGIELLPAPNHIAI